MGNSIDENETIEIWGSCGSEIGPSVGFGIEMSLKDFSSDDVSWIFEGMSDSISENWEEFDEAAEQTKTECLAYYLERNIIPTSEDEIKEKAKAILEQKLGRYEIEFEANSEDVVIDYVFSSEDISDAVYECVCSNFAIAFCVMHDLKEK